MTQANELTKSYKDTSELMTALNDANVESDQDWENETTTWNFKDGSKIIVSGDDVEIE